MKILITGASGNVGTYLIESLINDHEIVAVSRNIVNSKATKQHAIDLATQTSDFAQIFEIEKPDAVIHLAAILGQVCETDPKLAETVNVNATKTLAELSIKHGVGKFIFFSTAAVYSQSVLEPTNEENNVAPKGAYGKTKLQAEAEINQIAKKTDQTRFITFRPFNIYGPNFDLSLVFKLIHSSASNPVGLFGFNNMYRDYIHISDIAKATSLALDSNLKEAHAILNIASGVATSNADLIRALEAAGVNPVFTKSEQDDLNVSWADINKAKDLLGFLPATEIIVDK